MNPVSVVTALAWGFLFGYLAIRTLDSLLGIGFCLHGLLLRRWKQLARKVPTGTVKFETLLKVIFKLTLYLFLFTASIAFSDDFARNDLRFEYSGSGAILFILATSALVLSRLRATRNRLVHYWRMSHEFDYAERRRRTQLLR